MSQEKVRSIAHRLGWTWNPRRPGALRTISSSRPGIVRGHSTRRPAKPRSAQIFCTPGWSRRVHSNERFAPSSCHQVKSPYTVGQGGKSFGGQCQAHPVHTT